MSKQGDALFSLLHNQHGSECDGTEYSCCRPLVLPAPETERGAEIVVVYMEWCGDCGAADWEVV